MSRLDGGRWEGHRLGAVLVMIGAVIMVVASLFAGALGASGASGAAGAGGGEYTVHGVKASNIKDNGTLIRVRVSYTCPRGADVIVQASLNGLQIVENGVTGMASFGALDQQARCTGHRQHTVLQLPMPDAFEGARFLATQGVRAMGFLREIPTSDEVHEGGPFIQDIH